MLVRYRVQGDRRLTPCRPFHDCRRPVRAPMIEHENPGEADREVKCQPFGDVGRLVPCDGDQRTIIRSPSPRLTSQSADAVGKLPEDVTDHRARMAQAFDVITLQPLLYYRSSCRTKHRTRTERMWE
jgi:hypothetical protein